jgi:hypothetical protein
MILVRETTARQRGTLTVDAETWRTFMDGHQGRPGGHPRLGHANGSTRISSKVRRSQTVRAEALKAMSGSHPH